MKQVILLWKIQWARSYDINGLNDWNQSYQIFKVQLGVDELLISSGFCDGSGLQEDDPVTLTKELKKRTVDQFRETVRRQNCWQFYKKNWPKTEVPFTRPTLQCVSAGNTKGESITVPLTSCLPSLDQSFLQIKTRIVSCHTADSKPAKQEVNSTVILPPSVFPDLGVM